MGQLHHPIPLKWPTPCFHEALFCGIVGGMQETIGKRVARLRQEYGWTQQTLAVRLAISRVAVSQIEMDLTVPSERTVTLLSGLFKRSPQALVENTTYPLAKAERLPEVTCCYTALEHELALLDNDLTWLRRLAECPESLKLAADVQAKWMQRLETCREQVTDDREKALLESARQKLTNTTACFRATKESK
jgi:transcriptional regulator with XRE-family HTH domain